MRQIDQTPRVPENIQTTWQQVKVLKQIKNFTSSQDVSHLCPASVRLSHSPNALPFLILLVVVGETFFSPFISLLILLPVSVIHFNSLSLSLVKPPFHDSASQRSPVLHYRGEREKKTARNKHNTDNHTAFIRDVGSPIFAMTKKLRKERRKDGRNENYTRKRRGGNE